MAGKTATPMRCVACILLLGVLALMGCAGSGPSGPPSQPTGPMAAPVDSVGEGGVGARDSSTAARSERAIDALRAAYVEGAYDEVVRRAQKWRRSFPDTAAAIQLNTLLGRAEQARGQHPAAIKVLRRARVMAAECGRSLVALDRILAESYVAQYQWPRAASALRRVLEARPSDLAARRALAEVYRQARRWEEARAQYRHLVRTDSTNGKWWARLAQCALELGATDSARRHFQSAHRHLPQSADVALSLSRLHRATGRPAAAQRVVDSTLHHQPGDPRLWRRQADLAFEQDKLGTARRAYARTVATGDSSATVYRRMGIIDVRRGRPTRAFSVLQKSLRRDSTHSRTMLYLGIAALNLDRLQQATTYFRRTVENETRGPISTALERLGQTYDQQRHVGEAVRAYNTALRLRPERAVLYFRLATVYDEHYRDKKPAARYYRRFLRAADSTDTDLRRYAKSRLETLRPTLHMQRKGWTGSSGGE